MNGTKSRRKTTTPPKRIVTAHGSNSSSDIQVNLLPSPTMTAVGSPTCEGGDPATYLPGRFVVGDPNSYDSSPDRSRFHGHHRHSKHHHHHHHRHSSSHHGHNGNHLPKVIPPKHPFRTLILCFDGTGDQYVDFTFSFLFYD
jgi:hypothetical protein